MSQVLPNNPTNIKALAKVVAYYAPRASIPAGTNVGVSPSSDRKKGLAFTNQDGIMVTAKNGIAPLLNDYNNLTNTLVHEENHRKAGDPAKGGAYKFTDHTAIYEKQMDDKSFKGTDAEYKMGIATNYISYLLGALKVDQIDDNDFDVKIQSINTKLKPYSITISTMRTSAPLPAMTITGKNNKGTTVVNSGSAIDPKTDPK